MSIEDPQSLCRALLNPEDLGHMAGPEIRSRARRALASTHATFDLYLCGPMTGLPYYNHPEFMRVAGLLRQHGYTVFNPAENGLDSTAAWAQHMRVDIGHLVRCCAVATLKGHEASKGATLELHIASALGMPVKPAAQWLGTCTTYPELHA